MKKHSPEQENKTKVDASKIKPELSLLHKLVPVVLLLIAVLYAGSKMRPSKMDSAYNLAGFAQLPVSADGRVKPLDTVARNSLQVISGRSELEVPLSEIDQQLSNLGQPAKTKKIPAIQWLIEVMTRPEVADNYQVFRIDHPNVLDLIGVDDSVRKRFSFNEILAHQDVLTQQAQLASQVPSRERNPFQQHLMALWTHLDMYINLAHLRTPYFVPPDATHKEWRPFPEVVEEIKTTDQTNEAAAKLSALLLSYLEQKPEQFNSGLTEYTRLLQTQNPDAVSKTGFEVFFNRFSPFYLCIVLYIMVFFAACFSFLMRANTTSPWAETLGQGALWMALFTFAIHTFGLAARIYLQGRPPVTNLYSSAVFIGWGAVMISLLMEFPFRLSIGTLVSSVIGFATLIVAMNLAEGDTMEMMQAVLDSNFWLATHVVIVTAGYSATFLAGLLGVMYILLGTTTRMLNPETERVLTRMTYGVVCFALLLSFTGTVLGGIWADQSWGRFWGWDPKENGAVLIVLWNALILHARWGGMVRARGIMVLVVFGNIITAWSWFGTNMLGVGLHSYGFMDSAVFWLAVFMMSQIGIMFAGLLPLALWKSFATQPA